MLEEAKIGAGKVRTKNRKSFFVYIQELKDELKKVSWTSKKELKFATKMVLLSMFFLGLGIYAVDFLIKNGLDLVKTAMCLIFG